MGERALEQAPHPGDVAQILRLAVAPAQPGEDADHLGMALRRQYRPGGREVAGVKLGKSGEIAGLYGCDQRRRNVAPRIFQQRHEIVGHRPCHRVLEVEQAAGRDPRSRQPHQVVDMEVPQHQGFGHPPRHREVGPPQRRVFLAHARRWRRPGDFRKVPIDQQRRFGQKPLVVVGRTAGRHRIGAAMQVDQQVDRQPVEAALVPSRRQEAGIGVVAQILEEQQAPVLVRREHARRAVAEAGEMAGNGKERPHVLLGRRRVHQDGAPVAVAQALIVPERGIARQPRARGAAPAMPVQEGAYGCGTVMHVATSRLFSRPRARDPPAPPCGRSRWRPPTG